VKIGENPLLFRAGNFKTPNTLEDLTSDLYVDTLERAAFINAWQIDRQIGFMTAYYADHFGLSAGIFGDRPSSTASNPLFPGFIGDEDTAFAARARSRRSTARPTVSSRCCISARACGNASPGTISPSSSIKREGLTFT
jgi:phosphate-selective porin